MSARAQRSRSSAWVTHAVLITAVAAGTVSVPSQAASHSDAVPARTAPISNISTPDPNPLLTYAASQAFPPISPPAKEAADRKKLDRITFSLSKDPPPDKACAQTLGARRFAALFDDLGGVYSNLGDDGRAADAYTKAITCNPRAEFLHAQLAAALLGLGRYTEARAETQRELTLGRGNFVLHNLMTQLDFIEHHWPAAVENARLAATEAPDDEQATYWQCFLWLAQLHDGVALPALADRHTFSGWPSPILESLQGAISEAELVEAVSAERNLTRRREILTEALFYTGQLRLATKRPEEAIRYFNATTRLHVQYFIEHHLAVAELQRLQS